VSANLGPAGKVIAMRLSTLICFLPPKIFSRQHARSEPRAQSQPFISD
jgi:hypothetical protein